MSFPGSSIVKNLPAKAGDMDSIPGSGRPPGEGNGNPLQYFCLGNPVDRRAWWATVHRVTRAGHSLVTKPPHQPEPCTFKGVLVDLLSISMYCQTFEKKAVLSDVQKVKNKQDSFQRACLSPIPQSLFLSLMVFPVYC